MYIHHSQISRQFWRYAAAPKCIGVFNSFENLMKRRPVRSGSDTSILPRLIELAIMTAGAAPSGAHRQPWKFGAVEDLALKREIHLSAVREEHESYHHRMSGEWLEALAPLGTDWHKPFLEVAPWLVVCFAESHGVAPGGSRRKHYHFQESCGIACGLLIAAIHKMGLVKLTHTPSPMRFLRGILGRPSNERPYILFPVGYPAEDALVPALERKDLDDLVQWNRGQG